MGKFTRKHECDTFVRSIIVSSYRSSKLKQRVGIVVHSKFKIKLVITPASCAG